ncbi:L,D-transpeptidase [Periweissella fabaria]|uniref:L,D-TPase catalytic domain-containing protein n=1 Tax=Periweissella fabaria TaxID=546157 RepID=A0ABM8Z6R2_9LACO|nr:L,D-transpeptidase [Periweissella fabaria]MCM0597694.1 L,D-transpeptidase [Periweissella fabaria]CAH0416881.1 hypothetical protein WFA24289_01194 [Periweissella fabaria]
MSLKTIAIGVVSALVIVGGGVVAGKTLMDQDTNDNAASSSTSISTQSSSTSSSDAKSSSDLASSNKAKADKDAADKAKADKDADDKAKADDQDSTKTDPQPTPEETANKLRNPIDWRLSSEDKPYPDVNKYPNLWIHVSIAQQRVFLMTGNTVLYTMYCSTGMEQSGDGTPRGTFHIQKEQGLSFYNPTAQGGAYNWTSFHNHGEFLFHSVPIYMNGQYILSEAAKLGKEEASHGCIRLSVPDAKWFHDTIKYNTKVVID